MKLSKYKFLLIGVVSLGMNACSGQSSQEQNSSENMDKNIIEETNKKVTKVQLEKGEIFISFITNRKPNTDELFQSYLSSVFPVAIKHGAVPLANLQYDKVVAGDFIGTDFIGLSKWPNQESAGKFSAEMPEEKLNELRKPIWNKLKIFVVGITENLSFDLVQGQVYEYKLAWGSEEEIAKDISEIAEYKGNILFSYPVSYYQDLKDSEGAPDRIVLVEWPSAEAADEYRKNNTSEVKEEAFHTHLEITNQ